jgi:hypothetical protein
MGKAYVRQFEVRDALAQVIQEEYDWSSRMRISHTKTE